jgi:hypothetical protein
MPKHSILLNLNVFDSPPPMHKTPLSSFAEPSSMSYSEVFNVLSTYFSLTFVTLNPLAKPTNSPGTILYYS